MLDENDRRKKYLTLAQVQQLAQAHGLQLSRKGIASNATELQPISEQVVLLEGRVQSLESQVKVLQNTLQKHGNSLAVLAELQAKVSGLEVQIEGMKVQSVPTQPKVSRPSAAPSGSSNVALLPEGLVGWRSFADRHGIAQSTVQKAITSGRLAVVEGERGATVKGALDGQGQAQFYQLYHANGSFQVCEQCPHEGV